MSGITRIEYNNALSCSNGTSKFSSISDRPICFRQQKEIIDSMVDEYFPYHWCVYMNDPVTSHIQMNDPVTSHAQMNDTVPVMHK